MELYALSTVHRLTTQRSGRPAQPNKNILRARSWVSCSVVAERIIGTREPRYVKHLWFVKCLGSEPERDAARFRSSDGSSTASRYSLGGHTPDFRHRTHTCHPQLSQHPHHQTSDILHQRQQQAERKTPHSARSFTSQVKMEGQERVIKPKPKLTKAERRELQEKQRAAKSMRSSSEHGGSAPASSSAKPAQPNPPSLPSGSGKASTQVMSWKGWLQFATTMCLPCICVALLVLQLYLNFVIR